MYPLGTVPYRMPANLFLKAAFLDDQNVWLSRSS